ncbi:unnamed protein product, partial [Scytosiphon promiscuus]
RAAKALSLASLLALTTASPLLADDNHKVHRVDGHAPIGAMGDHLHKKGEFMFSYRFMS